MSEKYVYVMLESKMNNFNKCGIMDALNGYRGKLIGVFDSYELAKKCLDKWKDNMTKREDFKYGSINCDECNITLKVEDIPDNLLFDEFSIDYEFEVWIRRYIIVTILQSKEP